jgi:hypothetical protein
MNEEKNFAEKVGQAYKAMSCNLSPILQMGSRFKE